MRQARGRGDEGSVEGKPNRQRMRWAQLLKRVFKVDVESCGICGGKLKVIAAILAPSTIEKILRHLGLPFQVPKVHPARAPPQGEFGF